jgi:hypothetical protein
LYVTLAAVLVSGCWSERDAEGNLQWYGPEEFRAREEFLRQTEPDTFAEMRKKDQTGRWLVKGAAIGMGIAGGAMMGQMGGREYSDAEIGLLAGIGVAGLGSLIAGISMQCMYGPYIRKQGRRRLGLQPTPSGVALVAEF